MTLVLPPSRLAVTPGDVIAFTFQGRERRIVMESATGVFAREIECRALPTLSRSLPPPAESEAGYDLPPSLGVPLVYTLGLPSISGREGVLTWVAATATPWPGALTIWRGSESAGFVAAGQLGAAAIIGETLDDLPSGPLWRWDRRNALRVHLATGALSSLPEERVLSGGNVFALQTGQGWELVQFLSAELVAEQTYRLSGLLRGAGNSEAQLQPLVAAGAAIILLDGSVQPLVRDVASLGNVLGYRIGPSRYDQAHAAQAQLSVTPGNEALRPLAPVHLRARRTDEGISLSWIRRTRIGGDAWNVLEVPLGEDQESYNLSILADEGDVLRSLTTTSPDYLYTNALELEDFGSPVSQLRLSVSQLSPLVGAGFSAEVTLPL